MKIATAGFTCVDNYANLDNRHYPAGNGFDALVNLAKMGVECAVVSAVGPDKYGEEMFEVLKKYGVDSSHLHVLPGETSFMIMEMTENNDRVHVKNIPGVMDDFELTRDDVEFLKGYDYVHTEFSKVLYPYLAELQEAGCKIIFDLSTSYERHTETETLLRNIDYAFMSYPQRDEHVKELMKKYQKPRPHSGRCHLRRRRLSGLGRKRILQRGHYPSGKGRQHCWGGRLLPGRLYAWNYDRKIHPRMPKRRRRSVRQDRRYV